MKEKNKIYNNFQSFFKSQEKRNRKQQLLTFSNQCFFKVWQNKRLIIKREKRAKQTIKKHVNFFKVMTFSK